MSVPVRSKRVAAETADFRVGSPAGRSEGSCSCCAAEPSSSAAMPAADKGVVGEAKESGTSAGVQGLNGLVNEATAMTGGSRNGGVDHVRSVGSSKGEPGDVRGREKEGPNVVGEPRAMSEDVALENEAAGGGASRGGERSRRSGFPEQGRGRCVEFTVYGLRFRTRKMCTFLSVCCIHVQGLVLACM